MPQKLTPLITLGIIAIRCDARKHRVRRILETRPHIRAVARAGNTRLYDNEAVAQVRHELNTIDARRAAKGVGHVAH